MYRIRTYVCVDICVYVRMLIILYVCTRYVYTYIHTYAGVHIHTRDVYAYLYTVKPLYQQTGHCQLINHVVNIQHRSTFFVYYLYIAYYRRHTYVRMWIFCVPSVHKVDIADQLTCVFV